MEKMIDLKDLLKHEILDLYSAEEQIIDAMPAMIEKAKNPSLKKALKEHLKITEGHKGRLDQVKEMLDGGEGEPEGEKKRGFLSGLFGGGQVCKGTKGLIEEGEKVMGEKMTPEVLDAAIIASAQKIEHYEICSYGTARAFARELKLLEVAELLEETLDEEYEADDRLTVLAVGRINEEAETADASGNGSRSGRTSSGGIRGGSSSSRGSSSKRSGSSSSAGKRSSSNGNGSGKETSHRNNGRGGRSTKAVSGRSKSSSGRSSSKSGSSRGR